MLQKNENIRLKNDQNTENSKENSDDTNQKVTKVIFFPASKTTSEWSKNSKVL